jgi:hypothetical protein
LRASLPERSASGAPRHPLESTGEGVSYVADHYLNVRFELIACTLDPAFFPAYELVHTRRERVPICAVHASIQENNLEDDAQIFTRHRQNARHRWQMAE